MGRGKRRVEDFELREKILWLLSSQTHEKPGLRFSDLYEQLCEKFIRVSKSTFTRVLLTLTRDALIIKEGELYKITEAGFKKLKERDSIRLFALAIKDKKPDDIDFVTDIFRHLVNILPFEEDRSRSILLSAKYRDTKRATLLLIPGKEANEKFVSMTRLDQEIIVKHVLRFFEMLSIIFSDPSREMEPIICSYVDDHFLYGGFLSQARSSRIKMLEEECLIKDAREMLSYCLSSVLFRINEDLIKWLGSLKETPPRTIKAKPLILAAFYDAEKRKLVTPPDPAPPIYPQISLTIPDIRKLVEERIKQYEEELERWRKLLKAFEKESSLSTAETQKPLKDAQEQG